MTVRYRYPDEDWQVVGGDDWNCDIQQSYRPWHLYCEAVSMSPEAGCGNIVTLISSKVFYGRLISAEIFYQSDAFGEVPRFKLVREWSTGDRYEQVLISRYSPSPKRMSSGTVRISNVCQTGILRVQKDSFANFYAADSSRNRNPDGDSAYVFSVTKNNTVVHQEVRDICPEAEIVPDSQCPENTCEVICGDTICCYGSDGVAVTSFPRN